MARPLQAQAAGLLPSRETQEKVPGLPGLALSAGLLHGPRPVVLALFVRNNGLAQPPPGLRQPYQRAGATPRPGCSVGYRETKKPYGSSSLTLVV